MLRKNLSTEHTEGTDRWEFLVASLEILEEIFYEMLLRKKSDQLPGKQNLKRKS